MRLIPLTRGKFAKVDDSDYEEMSKYSWQAELKGNMTYAGRALPRVKGEPRRRIYMHVQILGTPKGKRSDHHDGDGLNNQRYNLRPATASQNAANSEGHKDRTSPLKGVIWDKNRNAWAARIGFNKRTINLGRYRTKEEAATAYGAAAARYFGEFAKLPNVSPS
jgi:hypothetical protein